MSAQRQDNSIPIDERLRLSEIYVSVQGESTHVGKPCVFVRLTGCNLRCTWCDSAFTFTGGIHRSIDSVVDEACSHGVHTIEVTGGEPLAQRQCIPLLERLVERGHEVLLETSGSIDIGPVPREVHVILDFKPPASGEAEKNLWSNVDKLLPHHEVKFVIASRDDFEWSVEVIRKYDLASRVAAVLISPAWGDVDPAELVQWLLDSGVNARFQLQMHKAVWPPDARGV